MMKHLSDKLSISIGWAYWHAEWTVRNCASGEEGDDKPPHVVEACLMVSRLVVWSAVIEHSTSLGVFHYYNTERDKNDSLIKYVDFWLHISKSATTCMRLCYPVTVSELSPYIWRTECSLGNVVKCLRSSLMSMSVTLKHPLHNS